MKRLSREAKERQLRLVRRRFRRRLARDARVAATRREKVRERPAKLRRSTTLDRYAHDAEIGDAKRKWTEQMVVAPDVFSFIDAPDDALAFMEQFVSAARAGAPVINVRQDTSARVETCAVSVLNALAMAARADIGTQYRGSFPSDPEAREIIAATGLPKQLGVPLPEISKIQVLGLIHGGEGGTALLTSSTKEREADKVVTYLDALLRQKDFELSRAGKRHLLRLLTEVLGNAEEHAGSPHRDWYVASYLRRPTTEGAWDCHVVIFNFGQTIRESLSHMPPASLMRADIDRLVSQHRRWMGSNWTEENLWTLYALQEGVTCFEDPGRGHGTVSLIEAFESLGGSVEYGKEPRMCIVSGRTHILFDGRYRMRDVALASGQKRKVIAFNDENDLEIPPAAGTVTHLRRPFPGTLISMRFFMDSASLGHTASAYGKTRH